MNSKTVNYILIGIIILAGGYILLKNTGNSKLAEPNGQRQDQVSEVEFTGKNGQSVELTNGQVVLSADKLDDNIVQYYNTKLSSGKTIYYFVVKDRSGVYRAAANACQVCYGARMGFTQEGNFMVCATCGNKYPLEKIATEKGGCNPGPINPNLKVDNGKIIINESELEQVADLF